MLPDNGKPRLYVADDSLARQITSAAEVAKNYEDANKGKTAPGFPFQARGWKA